METLKSRLREAFATQVEARPISNGYAVATPHENRMGDRIGFHAIGEVGGPYRLIDTALTVAYLEAGGASLDSALRRQHFYSLLSEYGAQYDEDLGEIFMANVSDADLPRKIVRFSAMLHGLNDLAWTPNDESPVEHETLHGSP